MTVKAILTDIEGTTTSISFVVDVLFPYAREHMAEFVMHNASELAVREQLQAVAEEAGAKLTDEQAVEQLLQWIEEDRKVTPLKALQGMIWESGYLNGDFTGHVYADAVENMRKWKQQGIDLYVYSSGSVKAQKLIFGYSDAGDLTPLFSGYFDTRIGYKWEKASYRGIADKIGLPTVEILFLSDIKEELDAAKGAGMQTLWLVRDHQPEADSLHCRVCSFNEICF